MLAAKPPKRPRGALERTHTKALSPGLGAATAPPESPRRGGVNPHECLTRRNEIPDLRERVHAVPCAYAHGGRDLAERLGARGERA